MDEQRFDVLTRALAIGATRRAGLKAALAALAGGGALVAADASAATTACRRGRQTCQRNGQCCSGTCQLGRQVPLKDRNRCTCDGGMEQCGSACVYTVSDPRNCGACGVRCHAAEACCNGECIDVREDEANCGVCGNVCDETETCTAGACLCIPDCDGKCGDDGCGGQCGAGPNISLDDGSCVDGDTYCDSDVWRTGNRADCFVSPQGEVMFGCWNVGAGYDYDWGANCTQTADCQAWCDGVTSYGCICAMHQVYADRTSEPEDYEGQGNYCVRKILQPFELQDAIDGDCGSWA